MADHAQPPKSIDAVRAVFAEGEPLTDAELVARLVDRNLHRGQVIPARGRLAKLGEVEMRGKNDRGVKVWAPVPLERHAEVAQAFANTKPKAEEILTRNRTPEDRAQIVAALLADPEVNQMLREQTERGTAFRRARARANESFGETEAEKRERKRKLKEARDSSSPYLEFLKIHDALREGISTLFAVRAALRADVGRSQSGEEMKVPFDRWRDVDKNVVEAVMVSGTLVHDLREAFEQPLERCLLCGERVARDPHALEEGYIDAEAVELSDEDLVDADVVA